MSWRVDVEPVERVVDAAAHGLAERLVAVRHEARVVDALEADRRAELVPYVRAERRDRDRRAVGERAARDQRAVVRACARRGTTARCPGSGSPGQPSFTRAVEVVVGRVRAEDRRARPVPTAGQPSFTKPSPSSSIALSHWPPDSSMPGMPPALGFAICTCVPRLDRLADAVSEVAHRARRRRDRRRARRASARTGRRCRRRPTWPTTRTTAPRPSSHVDVGAGERDAARVDAGTVHVLLDEELRHVVAGLRAEDGDRRARARCARRRCRMRVRREARNARDPERPCVIAASRCLERRPVRDRSAARLVAVDRRDARSGRPGPGPTCTASSCATSSARRGRRRSGGRRTRRARPSRRSRSTCAASRRGSRARRRRPCRRCRRRATRSRRCPRARTAAGAAGARDTRPAASSRRSVVFGHVRVHAVDVGLRVVVRPACPRGRTPASAFTCAVRSRLEVRRRRRAARGPSRRCRATRPGTPTCARGRRGGARPSGRGGPSNT